MSGSNTKTSTLILEAKNNTAKPFAEVAQSVDSLSAKLADQVSKVGTSDVTLRELTTTLGKLKSVQEEIGKQGAMVDRYRDLQAQLAKAGTAAGTAAAKLDELKAKQAASGTATDAQASKLNKAALAVTRTSERYAKLSADLNAFGTRLQAVGANVDNLETFQASLVSETTRVSQAMAAGAHAVDTFDEAVRRNKAALAEQTAATRTAAQAAKELADFDKAYAAATAENAAREQTAAQKKAQIIAQTNAGLTAQRQREQQAAAERAQQAAKEAAAADEKKNRTIANFNAQLAQAREERAAQDAKNQAIAQEIRDDKLLEQATYNYILAQQKRLGLTREQIALANSQNRIAPKERSEAGGKGTGFLSSFSAQEIQTLGYRLKDIIDQLGSGSGVLRVVAQQGAGTVADFQRQIGSLVTILPQLAAGVAIVALFGAALYRVGQSAGALREFNAQLGLSVDGAKYSADALVAEQRALQQVGAGFADAGTALREFISAGIAPEKLDAFAKAALNLTFVFGGKLPEAAKELTAAFTRNYAAVAELDNKYNFLTTAQRLTIRGMFEAGDAAGAQALAFDTLQKKLADVGEVAKGSFGEAMISAKSAFNSFLDIIANKNVVRDFAEQFGEIADAARDVTGAINGVISARQSLADPTLDDTVDLTQKGDRATRGSTTATATRVQSLKDEMAANQQLIDFEKNRGQANSSASQAAIEQNNLLKKSIDDLTGATAANNAETTRRQKIGADLLEQAQLERERGLRTDTAGRIAVAGRTAQQDAQAANADPDSVKAIVATKEGEVRDQIALEERRREEGVERELESLIKQGDNTFKDSLKDRLAAANTTYDAIEHKIQDLEARGKNDIFGVPTSVVRAQVAAQKELLDQQVTQKYYEDELTAATGERDAANKKLNEDVKAGTITAQNAYAQSIALNDKLSPKIKQLATDALAFGQALQKAKPGPTIDAFVDKAQRALGSESSGGKGASSGNEKEGEAALNAEIERGNQIVAARTDLQKALDEEVKKGVITQAQAEATLKANYAETDEALTQAIKDAQTLAATLAATGKDTAALDLYIAKLKLLQANQKFVSETDQEIKKGIQDAFASTAVKAVNDMATAVGKVVAGTENLKQGLRDAGVALASFVADFLKDIAEIILKKEAEIAVQAILDALGGGGGIGGAADSPISKVHSGGIVGPSGAGSTSVRINPAIFRSAPRYHSGGVVGLQPNEQAAILQHGEEVLTNRDPRNALNGGKSRGGNTPVLNMRHVLVMDPDLVPQAMKGATGEQVTMSHIKANAPTIRQILNLNSRR